MALIDNLISYWKLDEASGNALDAHGANELTDTNTVGTGTGIISNARDFEGDSNEHFVKADNADLSLGDSSWTFNAWVNMESTSTYRIIISKSGGAALEYFLYYYGADSRFRNETYGPSANGALNATSFGAPSVATWYMVTWTYDAAADLLGISVNAGTRDTQALAGGVNDSNGNFRIGADSASTSEKWDGLIDEVGFWKRCLSTAEVTELYNGGAGLAYPFDGGGVELPHAKIAMAAGMHVLSGGIA